MRLRGPRYPRPSVAAVHISYGQRTEFRERRAFEAICDRLGIRDRLIVRNEALRAIGGSALTDVKIPSHGSPTSNAARHQASRHLCAFPQRAFSVRRRELGGSLGATKVYIGAVEPDSSGYPDCRPEYYSAFNEVVRTGTRDGTIQIVTPLIAMRKHQIVRLGLELNAPFDLTWSCYQREDRACGVCDSCLLRLRAFREAGAEDPMRRLRRK